MDKTNRLAKQALTLKKAWLVVVSLSGIGGQLTPAEINIPNYKKWGNKELKKQIQDLEDDFDDTAKKVFLNWKRTNLKSTVQWLADKYDAWQKSGSVIYELGRVHEVEKAVGTLFFRKGLDCPPYAQVLLQGLRMAAIRHPEYHLGRDLALIYNLFLDSELIADEFLEKNIVHSTEHNQSLGRSVILTCFNLLEAFISGVATEYLIKNPNAPTDVRSKLENNRLPLKTRVILFPDLVTGKNQIIDGTKNPFRELLGNYKQRRDSFVHCESGSQPTKQGYVKEENFHDIDKRVVGRTVKLTIEAICFIWKQIRNSDKPSWLPILGDDGRFNKVEVVLQPIEVKDL